MASADHRELLHQSKVQAAAASSGNSGAGTQSVAIHCVEQLQSEADRLLDDEAIAASMVHLQL